MTLRRQSGPFVEGDQVQLTDSKGRLNTVTLERGKAFHSHRGVLPHESLIGLPDGSVVENSSGVPYLALRPLSSWIAGKQFLVVARKPAQRS